MSKKAPPVIFISNDEAKPGSVSTVRKQQPRGGRAPLSNISNRTEGGQAGSSELAKAEHRRANLYEILTDTPVEKQVSCLVGDFLAEIRAYSKKKFFKKQTFFTWSSPSAPRLLLQNVKKTTDNKKLNSKLS